MSKVQKITPECQPVFPCWLWNSHLDKWIRYISADKAMLHNPVGWDRGDYTHHHPDQPTAPTERPNDELDEFITEAVRELESPPPPPSPALTQAVEAAARELASQPAGPGFTEAARTILLRHVAPEWQRVQVNGERYRWLRDGRHTWAEDIAPVIMRGDDMLAGEKLDAAIDIARTASVAGKAKEGQS